jgi:hypothetical protein
MATPFYVLHALQPVASAQQSPLLTGDCSEAFVLVVYVAQAGCRCSAHTTL